MAYELGTYRKPGKPDRNARTPSEAVSAVWDGFTHVKSEDAPAPEVTEEAKVETTASAPSDAEKRAAAKAEANKPAAPKPQAPQA
jgi:hypothetical protein